MSGLCDGFYDFPIAERPRLDGHRRDVAQDCVDLLAHKIRRQALNALNSKRVLHRDERDDCLTVNTQLVKSFEIGLNTGAAARIGTRDS